MNLRAPLFLLVACGLTLAVSARAAVPSPANSSVPACMIFCPLGDAQFSVTVRDLANNPVAGAFVTLDFSNCPNAFICTPLQPFDPYTIGPGGRMLSMLTNGFGSATFPARVGGTAPAGCVNVYADGVLLRSVPLATPDQNGNGVALTILDNDFALFTAKVGTADPTADFDCDGDVDLVDQGLMGQHGSHSCFGIVDAARRRSWGSVKAYYR